MEPSTFSFFIAKNISAEVQEGGVWACANGTWLQISNNRKIFLMEGHCEANINDVWEWVIRVKDGRQREEAVGSLAVGSPAVG